MVRPDRSDSVVVKVEVDGCTDRHTMIIQMMYPMGSAVQQGCVQDAVWRIAVQGRPNRYTRLNQGQRSLHELLRKYSFTDASGCMYSIDPEQQARRNVEHNSRKLGILVDVGAFWGSPVTRKTRFYRASREEVLRFVPSDEIGRCHFARNGIAQLSEASGICWYSAMFFALLSPPDLREHIMRHVRKRQSSCKHCSHLSKNLPQVLHSQEASESMRCYLYDNLSIGDDPKQAPELDGQNGASMATLLCGAVHMPAITILAPWLQRADMKLKDAHDRPAPLPPEPAAGERAILFVRTYRTRWKAPETIMWPPSDGRRYRLQSALIGSEHCGHQVSIARSCEKETWSFSDSDGIRVGILPMCFRKPGHATWADTVTHMIPVSNASHSTSFCDMSPTGRHPLKALHDALRAQDRQNSTHNAEHLGDVDSTAHDLINVDYIYLEDR